MKFGEVTFHMQGGAMPIKPMGKSTGKFRAFLKVKAPGVPDEFIVSSAVFDTKEAAEQTARIEGNALFKKILSEHPEWIGVVGQTKKGEPDGQPAA